MELKALSAVAAEFKFSESSNGPGAIEGYGAYFNNVDGGGDMIRPGAFAEFLSARGDNAGPLPMLYEHDPGRVAGVWTHMAEDGKGLLMRGHFIDTTLGREAATEVKSGAKTGLSIGFTALASSPRVQPSDPRRTITKVHLWEVSTVTFPMNDKARTFLDAKSMSPSEIERIVRDVLNLSKSEAKAFMAEGFAGLKGLRDGGDDESNELASIIRQSINSLKGVAQ